MRFVAYRDPDAERVAEFYGRVHALDRHVGTTTPEAFRRYAALRRNRGGRDFELVEHGREVVALLLSARPPGLSRREVRVVVHPDYRRRGLGRALLARAAAQAPAASELMGSVRKQAGAACAFARALGFAVIARRVRMRYEGAAPPVAAPPCGVRLREAGACAADSQAWLQLEREAFSDLPAYSQSTPDDLALLRAAPGFRVVFAEQQGRVLGMCHSTRFWGTPYAELLSLAVAAPARRAGIGRALALDALCYQHAAGASATELVTEADNPARALYEQLGFEVVAELLTYSGHVPCSAVAGLGSPTPSIS